MPFHNLDPNKIQAKINELNAENMALRAERGNILEADDWALIPGIYIINEVNAKPDEVEIKPWGLIIKLFINKKTGEIKSFPARMFE